MSILTVSAPGWLRLAACGDSDPELFFGADGETDAAKAEREAEAVQVCERCPVRAWCLAFAGPAEYGVFGGLTEDERRTPRRRHRKTVLQENTVLQEAVA